MAKQQKGESTRITKQGDWVTYRPDIKVLDCTIRDGGLMNDHKFDHEFVKAVYKACVDAGIDYMELGYKASKKDFFRRPSLDPGNSAMKTPSEKLLVKTILNLNCP